MPGLESVPFLGGYMTMDAANRQREAQGIGQAAQFMTLQGAMQEQQAKRAALEREATFRTRLAGATTDEQRAQIAMEAAGPTGVLTHLDKVSRDRATAETARARMTQTATQFMETKRLRQAEIDRMTNNDAKRDAQRALDNEAKAFRLQLEAEAARLSGARGADTIMGFQPSPIPAVPTMQPAASGVAPFDSSGPATFSFKTPSGQMIQGEAPSGTAAEDIGLAATGQRRVGTPLAPQISPAAAVAGIPAEPVQSQQSFPQVDAENLDARDLKAREGQGPSTVPYTQMPARPAAPITPVPGQGVPGVRASFNQPQMPAFTGSPREVRKAQNDWKDDMAKAQMKAEAKDGKISLTGGRESVFINRVVNSGNQAAADLANVVKLPISASRGLFGGRQQGKGLLDASQETLANTMTSQEVQTYNVFATGFQRALAAIEGAGLAPAGALMHQMDAIIFKEGDTNFTKLAKLAQTRQIVEKGLETITANSRVDQETKKLAQNIIEKVKEAVPFTGSELIELQQLQNVDPKASLRDVMAKAKQQQNAPGWSDEKERRFQELKRKQGGT